jgi:hypothetical protein
VQSSVTLVGVRRCRRRKRRSGNRVGGAVSKAAAVNEHHGDCVKPVASAEHKDRSPDKGEVWQPSREVQGKSTPHGGFSGSSLKEGEPHKHRRARKGCLRMQIALGCPSRFGQGSWCRRSAGAPTIATLCVAAQASAGRRASGCGCPRSAWAPEGAPLSALLFSGGVTTLFLIWHGTAILLASPRSVSGSIRFRMH